MDFNTLSEISNALPDGFSFYGFGEVSRAPGQFELESGQSLIPLLVSGKTGVSFRLLGDPAALLIILFDSKLDTSMYTEIGNTLASKLCQRLSEKGEGDLMITPPLPLTSSAMVRLAQWKLPYIHQSYVHADQDQVIPIEALILPITAGGQIGHA